MVAEDKISQRITAMMSDRSLKYLAKTLPSYKQDENPGGTIPPGWQPQWMQRHRAARLYLFHDDILKMV